MTATYTPPTPAVPSFEPKKRTTFADALRSEWTKFWTVRATFWCLLLSVVLGVGLCCLVSALGASRYKSDPTIHIGWNATEHSLRALLIAQLVFAVFGVITVTSEYSSGMIRTSLAAVPKRGRLLAAKLVVFAVVAFVGGQVIAFAAFSIGQFLIHGQAPSASLGQHLVLRAVIGAGLYLALLGILGLAFGFLLRNAAAGIAVMVGLMLVLPGIILALPNSWQNPLEKYWPTQAGEQVYAVHRDAHTLTAWIGFGWMAVFTVIVVAAAYTVLERRDA